MSEELAKVALSRKDRAVETEAALKRAARAEFAERGYLATKITDITQRAGRSAGSFYNHFSGKEQLLAALLADLFEAGDVARMRSDSGHREDFTTPEAIRWHIAAFWEFVMRDGDVLAALNQAAQVNEEFAKQLRAMVLAQQADLLGHLDYVVKAGRRLPGPPQATMTAMWDMVSAFAESWRATDGFGGTVDEEQAIELLTTFAHRGLNG